MPPNTELALPLGDTHPHIFWLKQCQADRRHVTILHRCLGPPLPLHPQTALHHHALWIEPRARPGQPCDPAQTWLTQANPPSTPSASFLSATPTSNLYHRLSLDRRGLGIDGGLAASVLAAAICFVSPRKARETAAFVCQLVALRAVASENSVPCQRTLTHCHCAVQCDWSGPFSQHSQVRRSSGPPTASPVGSSHDIPTSTTQTPKSCQLANKLDMLCLQLS